MARPLACPNGRRMVRPRQRANDDPERLKQLKLEAELLAAIDNAHAKSLARGGDRPIKLIALLTFFLLSGGLAAELVHEGLRLTEFFHDAGF